jgi:hypothetical protein
VAARVRGWRGAELSSAHVGGRPVLTRARPPARPRCPQYASFQKKALEPVGARITAAAATGGKLVGSTMQKYDLTPTPRKRKAA